MMRLKVRILNFLWRRLFNALLFGDFLKIESRNLKNGKKIAAIKVAKDYLPDVEVQGIIEEARALKRFRLWTLLLNDLKSQATEALVNKSQHIDDMVFSKAMLYNLDMIEKKIDALSDL